MISRQAAASPVSAATVSAAIAAAAVTAVTAAMVAAVGMTMIGVASIGGGGGAIAACMARRNCPGASAGWLVTEKHDPGQRNAGGDNGEGNEDHPRVRIGIPVEHSEIHRRIEPGENAI